MSCTDYVPVGGSRSFPCLPDDVPERRSPRVDSVISNGRPSSKKLVSDYKSIEMTWYDERGVKLASTGAQSDVSSTRIYVNSRKNLTLNDARPENTGRYQCVATATVANASNVTVVNVLRINGQPQHTINYNYMYSN